MKGAPRKPRWVSAEDLDTDHRLRYAVRHYLRTRFPDLPRPPGPGWLMVPAELECPDCDAFLVRVHVPNVAVSGLVYCPGCDSVGELPAGY